MPFPELPPKRAKASTTPKPKGQHESARVSMQHERLIGRLVIVWSKIESALDNTIWEMVGLEMKNGRHLTRTLNADGKIKALRMLARNEITDEYFKQLDLILVKIGDCQEDRNFIMHGAWGTQITVYSNVPLVLSTRPKSEPDKVIGETFPAERMHQIINDGITCLRALVALLDVLETSPEKFRKPPHPA